MTERISSQPPCSMTARGSFRTMIVARRWRNQCRVTLPISAASASPRARICAAALCWPRRSLRAASAPAAARIARWARRLAALKRSYWGCRWLGRYRHRACGGRSKAKALRAVMWPPRQRPVDCSAAVDFPYMRSSGSTSIVCKRAGCPCPSARPLLAHPANGMTTTSTCLLMVVSSAASSTRLRRP
jgi:hypothetical protein